MNDKPLKILVFCCATSYDQSQIMQAPGLREFEIKVISLPCSGKLDILYLLKAFETGADGVAVMICKKDECRYMEGNMRAGKRADAVADLLEETGFGKNRLALIQMSDGGIEQALKKLQDFSLNIANLSKNNRGQAVPS